MHRPMRTDLGALTSNNELERRGAAPAPNEGTLSQSSTPSSAILRWLGALVTAVRSRFSDFRHRYFKTADNFCGGVIEPASQRYED